MDALQSADDRNDEDAAWAGVRTVLTCLYRLEEQEKQADDIGYYQRRGNSTDGRIVAGLIWLRGLILLHDAEVRSHLFRPFAIAGDDGALQPLTMRSGPGGHLVLVDDVVWPERRHLPAPGRRYKAHQRDEYYDELVAGSPSCVRYGRRRATSTGERRPTLRPTWTSADRRHGTDEPRATRRSTSRPTRPRRCPGTLPKARTRCEKLS